jgi:Fe-S-cluster-containing hydrogenase component 2
MPSHVDNDKCLGCGTCADKCPEEAITMVDDKPQVNDEECTECGVCVIACPVEARNIAEVISHMT